jgi:hypothetical protein
MELEKGISLETDVSFVAPSELESRKTAAIILSAQPNLLVVILRLFVRPRIVD